MLILRGHAGGSGVVDFGAPLLASGVTAPSLCRAVSVNRELRLAIKQQQWRSSALRHTCAVGLWLVSKRVFTKGLHSTVTTAQKGLWSHFGLFVCQVHSRARALLLLSRNPWKWTRAHLGCSVKTNVHYP